jgi:hypothetical protein
MADPVADGLIAILQATQLALILDPCRNIDAIAAVALCHFVMDAHRAVDRIDGSRKISSP